MQQIMNKIYIKLPSLDDTELIPTIKDAVSKADKPENLVFGIYLLYEEEENLNNLVQVTENLKESYKNVSQKINELNSKLNELAISRTKFAGAIEVLQQIVDSAEASAASGEDGIAGGIPPTVEEVITKDGVTYKAVPEKKS